MNIEQVAAIVAIGSTIAGALGSFVGSWIAQRVHLAYLRRDLDATTRSVKAAHWRLDEVGAPHAPSVSR